MGFLSDIGHAVRSLGGAAAAPLGAAYDVSQAVFDDIAPGGKTASFSDVLDKLSARGEQIAKPIAWTSREMVHGLDEALKADNSAYEHVVDRPLSTLAMMDPTKNNWFDGQQWANAWKISKYQNLGESLFGASTAKESQFIHDPSLMQGKDAQGNPAIITPASSSPHDFLGSAASFATNFMTGWYLDPSVLAGKGYGAYRQSVHLAKLPDASKAFAGHLYGAPDPVTGVHSFDMSVQSKRIQAYQGRVDGFLSYINGANKLNQPLNGAQIARVARELGPERTVDGHAIAHLLADAFDKNDVAGSIARQKQILAVTTGDVGQINALQQGADSSRAIGDALTDIVHGEGPLNMKLDALNQLASTSPDRFADLSRKLTNVDSEGELTKSVGEFTDRINAQLAGNQKLLEQANKLDYVPAHHALDNLRLNRVNETRLIDKVSQAHKNVDEWAQNIAHSDAASSVFQKSLYHVPLITVKAVGMPLSVWTKAPSAVMDAGRQIKYTGVADLNQWGDAMDQFDSMLRIAGAPVEHRQSLLSAAAGASTESEKIGQARKIESESLKALAAGFVEKHGYDTVGGKAIDSGFIEKLVDNHISELGRRSASINATKYAADSALLPEDLKPLYARTAATAADQTAYAEKVAGSSLSPEQAAVWRVDQVIGDDGSLMSVPLLSSQLGNKLPLTDIEMAKRVLSNEGIRGHLADLSHAWRQESLELQGLQARAHTMGAAANDRLSTLIAQKLQAQEALEQAGRAATRFWKFSVLFRLGYPMRILADDHLRIAATQSYARFLGDNVPEGFRNFAYNHAPALFKGRADMVQRAYANAMADRADILSRGITLDHSPETFKQIDEAQKVLSAKKASDAERTAAQATIDRLDPQGRIAEYYTSRDKIAKHLGSASAKSGAITRWRNELANEGVTPERRAALNQKIAKATVDREGLLSRAAFHQENLPLDSPEELRARLGDIDDQLTGGHKARKAIKAGAKRQIGDAPVRIPLSGSKNFVELNGAFAGDSGAAYRAEDSSMESGGPGDALGEAPKVLARLRAGAYQTYSPTANELQHLEAWEHVLNHQVKNAPDAMYFVRNPDASVQDFTRWLHQPENRHLVQRMSHFTDPEDWGGRVRELVRQYAPTQAIRDQLSGGRVTPEFLRREMPIAAARPEVHGQVIDYNTGRHNVVGLVGGSLNKMMENLATKPTDMLSRQPLFNTAYKNELRSIAAKEQAYAEANGTQVSTEDYARWERVARQKALGTVKRTLWDISAHSHAAHQLRFVSPFFAAHQEALSRWWNFASDDPSVIPHFQMMWSGLRNTGLVFDSRTGEPVKPSDRGLDMGVSTNDRVLLRLPWMSDKSAANTLIRHLGGDQYFSLNEDGLNVILQNGVTQPGTGPFVAVPMEVLARKYRDNGSLQKITYFFNQYPQQSLLSMAEPASVQKISAIVQGLQNNGSSNVLYAQATSNNLSSLLTQWHLDHNDTEPSPTQYKALLQKASDHAVRDLSLQAASNLFGFTPAKPMGKYAAVLQGWQRIQQQGDAQGKDYDWKLKKFNDVYGDAFDALIQSTSLNPAGLEGTQAEVSAIKRYGPLLKKLNDPSLAAMVVGPADAMSPESARQYNPGARLWEQQTTIGPGDPTTWIGTKSPKAAGTAAMVNDGWTQYDELQNALQVEAEREGLQSYTDSDRLKQARAGAIQQLMSQNHFWRDEFLSTNSGKYDDKLDDMRTIASSKLLTGDTERQDVQQLNTYLEARDRVTELLNQRRLAGGSGSIGSSTNADLSNALNAVVNQLRQQNTYFDTYMYGRTIAFDPYLKPALEGN